MSVSGILPTLAVVAPTFQHLASACMYECHSYCVAVAATSTTMKIVVVKNPIVAYLALCVSCLFSMGLDPHDQSKSFRNGHFPIINAEPSLASVQTVC